MPIISLVGEIGNHSNCSDGVQWVWVAFHDCIYGTKEEISTICGLVSMVIWLSVGIPQIVKNCRNIKAVEGLSAYLLLQWFLGDGTNLIGCILTHQLPIQMYTAIYYVSADVILMSQFIYCKLKLRRKGITDNNGVPRLILCFAATFLAINAFQSILSTFPISIHGPASRPGRVLLSVDEHNLGWHIFQNPIDITGYVIGIISSMFYIGSRVAQIYKNVVRKSTEGVSVWLFILAVFGNLFYGLSILLRSVDGVFLIRHTPWLIGSLGVMLLDATILFQFFIYRVNPFDAISREPLLHTDSVNCDIDDEDE